VLPVKPESLPRLSGVLKSNSPGYIRGRLGILFINPGRWLNKFFSLPDTHHGYLEDLKPGSRQVVK